MERSVVQGLAAFRWAAWAWLAAVAVVSRDELERPGLAIALAVAALGITGAATWWLRTNPDALMRPAAVTAELAIGLALVLADGWAYGEGHAFSTSQSLGSVWPLAGVLMAGVAAGPFGGAAAGTLMGLARLGATLVNGASVDEAGRILSLSNTIVFYAVGGAVAGYVFHLLRRAEREISAARAREEVARTLHDGVLQTLALVEHRASDPALSRLAREQERELREFLFGARPIASDLPAALRAAAGRFEDTFGGRADVVVDGDAPNLGERAIAAVAGAVGEALTNAGKHGGASRATVYVNGESGLFCSVKDNGTGCDPATLIEGTGLTGSVRGRIEELGGRVELAGAQGRGMEVRMWIP